MSAGRLVPRSTFWTLRTRNGARTMEQAEVDAGPRSAVREPVWINTAQIITIREAACSE
jgi:hypothetical protein